MELTSKQVHNAKRADRLPPIKALSRLCSFSGLTMEALLTNSVDLVALARDSVNGSACLPARYTEGAFSRRSTAKNILNYVQLNFGWEKRAALLKRFQLNESHFTNSAEWINMRFSLDLATHLYQNHRSELQLREIGHLSTVTHWNSGMGHDLRRRQSVKEVYESFIDLLAGRYLEKNFTWRLSSLGVSSCTITGRPSTEIIEAIGLDDASNSLGCWIRQGVIEAVPLYCDLPLSKVTKTGCIAQGDHECAYHVDFGAAVFQQWRGDETPGLQTKAWT